MTFARHFQNGDIERENQRPIVRLLCGGEIWFRWSRPQYACRCALFLCYKTTLGLKFTKNEFSIVVW